MTRAIKRAIVTSTGLKEKKMHDSYHDDQITPAPSLSSSIAKVMIGKSPLHAWMEHPRLNQEYKEEKSAQFDLGTSAHALLLEGEDCIREVDAPDWRTKLAKDQRDELRDEGRIPLLVHQAADVRRMAKVAREAWDNCPDLEGGYRQCNGEAEKAIYWQDEKTGIWCRAKPDWRANDNALILDYKSTARSANPANADRLVDVMGYDVQAAAYVDAVMSLPNVTKLPKFVFLIQEVEPPFACSFVGLSPAFLELGMEKWEHAKRMWATCLRTGHWPAYPDRICWVDPLPWTTASWQQRAYEHDDETTPPDAKWLGA